MLAAYVGLVDHQPVWAVEEACKAAAARAGAWPPSAGELAKAVDALVQAIRQEGAQIKRVLEAQVFHVETDEERAHVSAGFDQLREDLALHDEKFHKPGQPHEKYRLTKVDYERMVEEMEANPVVLPPMSDTLRSIVRRQEAVE